MSLKSWKAEFYLVPAREVPASEAVERSLQKWRGLRKENLERHNVFWNVNCIVDVDDPGHELDIDSDTCPLCVHFFERDYEEPRCITCPLYAALGGCPCDFEPESPYLIWINTGDPEPMIAALELALAQQNLKSGK